MAFLSRNYSRSTRKFIQKLVWLARIIALSRPYLHRLQSRHLAAWSVCLVQVASAALAFDTVTKENILNDIHQTQRASLLSRLLHSHRYYERIMLMGDRNSCLFWNQAASL